MNTLTSFHFTHLLYPSPAPAHVQFFTYGTYANINTVAIAIYIYMYVCMYKPETGLCANWEIHSEYLPFPNLVTILCALLICCPYNIFCIYSPMQYSFLFIKCVFRTRFKWCYAFANLNLIHSLYFNSIVYLIWVSDLTIVITSWV